MKTYKFNQLDKTTRASVIEDHRYVNLDYHWTFSHLIEDWTERLESLGFQAVEIYWEWKWDRGRGAWFEYQDVELDDRILPHWKTLNQPLLIEKVRQKLDGNPIDPWIFKWDNKNQTELGWEMELTGADLTPEAEHRLDQEWFAPIQAAFKERVEELNHQIYRDLEQEYEHAISDEVVADTLEAWDQDYDEHGNPA